MANGLREYVNELRKDFAIALTVPVEKISLEALENDLEECEALACLIVLVCAELRTIREKRKSAILRNAPAASSGEEKKDLRT